MAYIDKGLYPEKKIQKSSNAEFKINIWWNDPEMFEDQNRKLILSIWGLFSKYLEHEA